MIIEIKWYELLLAYLFIFFSVGMLRFFGISKSKELITSSIRMTVQLFLVGYILKYIFDVKYIYLTVVFLLIMEAFAFHTVIKRAGKIPKPLYKYIFISLLVGSLSVLTIFLIMVIGLRSFEPRYIIAISGMILGNSMNALSIAVRSLNDGFKKDYRYIESLLMLGATPGSAIKKNISNSFTLCIIPQINSMVSMGIVSLPGMMTGQILQGASPLIATRYQIAIILAITGGVSLTSSMFLTLSKKVYFNKRKQLIEI